ncbi:transmembrane protein 35B-like [Saccoglossus kowalevskii]|uniref:Uncharacterized protein ZMYM6NB-like n=1 Tax=Saccoglossus kowalevskii TaxID=10224 RepID=A0ABM0GLC2_SACKO|nr:PREDICTED: uncharacterized protein ZMYM6NB-like [Saccoglossus kowalevskii]
MGVFRYVVYALGVLFIVAGGSKLCPAGVMHEEMTKAFVRFSTVFPLLRFDIKPEPAMYQFVVGIVETVGGLILLVGPLRLKKFTALLLIVIMAGATFTLQQLHEPPAQIAFPVVIGLTLIGILCQCEVKSKED